MPWICPALTALFEAVAAHVTVGVVLAVGFLTLAVRKLPVRVGYLGLGTVHTVPSATLYCGGLLVGKGAEHRLIALGVAGLNIARTT